MFDPMNTVNTEVSLFKQELLTWRSVNVTPAVKMGMARRAILIADKLVEANEPDLARRWRQIAQACREDNVNFVIHMCNRLIPQTITPSDPRIPFLGKQYVDEADSGEAVMTIIAMVEGLPDDVAVQHPYGRTWQRNYLSLIPLVQRYEAWRKDQ